MAGLTVGSLPNQVVAWLGFSATGGLIFLNVVALVVLLTAVIWSIPLARYGADVSSGFVCGLIEAAPLVPLAVAALFTVTIYVLPITGPAWDRPHHVALLLGSLLGLVSWLAWGVLACGRSSASKHNSRMYAELSQRAMAAEDWYVGAPNPLKLSDLELDAWATVRESLDFVEAELGIQSRRNEEQPRDDRRAERSGLRWTSGAGYLSLWSRLHQAEEALILVKPAEAAVGSALHDHLRLQDSSIPNRELLLGRLTWAVHRLDPAISLTPKTGAAYRASDTPPTFAGPSSDEGMSHIEARTVLREVRQAINEFRDGLWEGLVRQRHNMVQATIFTQLAFMTVLGVLILIDAPRHAILAAVVFCVSGGVVGLFRRLASTVAPSVEDYGLSTATLILGPLFSGLEGLAGVLLISLALDPLVSWPLLPHAPTDHLANLNQIFSLKNNPGGVLVAAVFGLAADLVLQPLYRTANRYKRDILTSQATHDA